MNAAPVIINIGCGSCRIAPHYMLKSTLKPVK